MELNLLDGIDMDLPITLLQMCGDCGQVPTHESEDYPLCQVCTRESSEIRITDHVCTKHGAVCIVCGIFAHHSHFTTEFIGTGTLCKNCWFIYKHIKRLNKEHRNKTITANKKRCTVNKKK